MYLDTNVGKCRERERSVNIWVPPLDDIILAQSLSINIMWMS